MEETEAGDNLIPARRWIRGHYTKLTSNEARCNHCNEKLSIHLNSLHTLHKHLIEAHPDKLAEEEKNEVKFHWVWDYYVKNSTEATCKQCKATVRYKKVYDLKRHLKRKHGILGPTSDNVIDNESSSDDDMNANKDITLRKVKRQEASSNLTNLSDSLNEYTEGIKGLNEKTPYNLIKIRRWMREHYTKLTRNRVRCNHCNEKFSIYMSHLVNLHKHLIEAHPDKLTEEEKNEVKFHWAWDYYVVKSSTEATCKQCKATLRYKKVYDLKRHLKRKHGILGPTSDNVIDNESSLDDDMNANKDITLRKVKRQEASSNLTNLSDSLNEYTEGIKGLNEDSQNNFVPVRLWIRGHYTRLTRNNEALCIHCNRIFIILIHRLSILHKHLVESHPDKLAEEEKNEVKFHWAWDYYSVKSSTEATCKQCKITIRYMEDYDLKGHLKIKHEIFGPGSDNHMDNENNSSNYVDADRNTTIKKAKYQEDLSNLKSGTFMYQFT